MSAPSSKIWKAAVAAGRSRASQADPMLQIGSTLESLYALDDQGDVHDGFADYLDRINLAHTEHRNKKHDN
ncbi:hypothetical protein [Pararhizobium sp.]|uniref:hypothetical protein n=1 Tax=Pararhizobium sp. TaxID=1977563 RepID=UPI0027251768|nr:hypothetical protein [Pararhizobium sp.]MDO9418329.1 hypothetical protein [Pararhizobium sp.]